MINKPDNDYLELFKGKVDKSIDSKVALKFSELCLVLLMNMKKDIAPKLTALTNTKNTASSWFDIVQQTINTMSDFERKFKARFWNEDIQEQWSRKVEYNRYNSSSKLSHLEHATYATIQSKHKHPPQSRSKIILDLEKVSEPWCLTLNSDDLRMALESLELRQDGSQCAQTGVARSK
ncbi:hypothetical protein TSAR_014080 [Trichomalopsis sarcophagae]|uniref:Uncharacterized protein n=1 Tax=Trichomalopsis sarcophagae TaxID=543379 RepID=A0A232EVY4_9HYME|nr:hypothetical protein TSAR_014080 [Trichomalopsis sarcophagae]